MLLAVFSYSHLIPNSFGLYSGLSMPGASRKQDAYFRFLRRLRFEGRTNMYGAIPYLMRWFALDRDNAFRIVCDWLDQQRASAELEPKSKPPRRKPARRRAA
jgi:hypothetical protein